MEPPSSQVGPGPAGGTDTGAGDAERRTSRRPSGRRPGGSGTRDAILAAAREQFAAQGYRGATMRTIAAAARVDPALIRHFFGGKDELFAATVDLPTDAAERMVVALTGDRDGLGERVVRVYLGLWEDPTTAAPLLSMFRSAVSSERAADLLREFLSGQVLNRVAPDTGMDHPRLRATLAASHLLGTAVARYVVRVPPLADMELEDLVTVLAPTVHGHLTAPFPAQFSAPRDDSPPA
jgi:AcrR family transcriptional regulator